MKKIILSVTLLGFGFFGVAQEVKTSEVKELKAPMKMSREQVQEVRLQKMKSDLNLTDSQVAQFKELNAKRAAEMKTLREAQSGDRLTRFRKNEEEYKKILTPEQYKKYQDLKELKKNEMREKMEKKKTEAVEAKK